VPPHARLLPGLLLRRKRTRLNRRQPEHRVRAGGHGSGAGFSPEEQWHRDPWPTTIQQVGSSLTSRAGK
jgi:hypothetical protein